MARPVRVLPSLSFSVVEYRLPVMPPTKALPTTVDLLVMSLRFSAFRVPVRLVASSTPATPPTPTARQRVWLSFSLAIAL